MIFRKVIFCIVIFNFIGACTSPTAMLGPAYTLTSNGSIYQAGLNYGSHEMITMYTGKTPIENIKDITEQNQNEEKNFMKATLESDGFYNLVKFKIEKTRDLFQSINQ